MHVLVGPQSLIHASGRCDPPAPDAPRKASDATAATAITSETRTTELLLIRLISMGHDTVAFVKSPHRLVRVTAVLAIASTALLLLDSAPAPASGSGLAGELFAVDALAATNVWAVGDYYPAPSDPGDYFTVTEHRHGSTW